MLRAVLGAACALVLFAAPARAATLTVDQDRAQCPRAQFASIQAAIDNARPGDTVKVCAGLYGEALTVNKPLTLRGPGGEVDCFGATALDPSQQAIVSPPGSVAVRLAADDVELRGFAIRGASVGVDASDAFAGYRVTQNVIQDSSLFAIDAGSAGGARFDHNCLRDNGYGLVSELDDDTLWPQPPVGSDRAAFARNLRDARVDHNDTTRNGSGVEAAGPGRPVAVRFDHNRSHADGVGVAIQNSVASEVADNEILDADGNGIAVGGNNADLAITANVVHSSGAAINLAVPGSFYDVFTAPSRFAVIRGNDLHARAGSGLTANSGTLADSLIRANTADGDSLTGFAIAAGNTGNLIAANEANGNGRNGIFLVAGATGNTVSGNVMHGNGALNPLTFFDARDDNRPINTWLHNDCVTDSPAGAICGG